MASLHLHVAAGYAAARHRHHIQAPAVPAAHHSGCGAPARSCWAILATANERHRPCASLNLRLATCCALRCYAREEELQLKARMARGGWAAHSCPLPAATATLRVPSPPCKAGCRSFWILLLLLQISCRQPLFLPLPARCLRLRWDGSPCITRSGPARCPVTVVIPENGIG